MLIPTPYSLDVRRLERNTAGRDLIVGDIHGCFEKLSVALDDIGFNPDAGDRLISVGDLVDRGPTSGRALDWIFKPWFHAVRGNHEDMLCMYRDGQCSENLYRMNGGGWFIDLAADEQERIAMVLRGLPLAIEIETEHGLVGVVHADCPTDSWSAFRLGLTHPDMGPRMAMACTWSRTRAEGLALGPIADVRAVVVGHTPMERHTTMDNVHFIDTGAWLPAHRNPREFTILDAATLIRAFRPVAA